MHLKPLESNPDDTFDETPSASYTVAVEMSRKLPWRPDNEHESLRIRWWNRAGQTYAPLPPGEEMEALMVAAEVIRARMVQLDAMMSKESKT